MRATSVLCFLTIIVVVGCGCHSRREKAYGVKELHVGLTSTDLYKTARKIDPAEDPVPPPPPFTSNLAVNNIIEANDGKVYFYSFLQKHPFCGYMLENDTIELYQDDLKVLKAGSLKPVDPENIDSIMQQITDIPNKDQSIMVTIGIQGIRSENKVLIKMVNSFLGSVKIVWKVRRLNTKEEQLLNEIGGAAYYRPPATSTIVPVI